MKNTSKQFSGTRVKIEATKKDKATRIEFVRYEPLGSGTWHFWVVEGLQSGMISYYAGYGYCITGSDSPNFPTRPANYWPRRFIHVSISPEKKAKWINNSVSVVGHRLWSWATIENMNTLPNKHNTLALFWTNAVFDSGSTLFRLRSKACVCCLNLCWNIVGIPSATLAQNWSKLVMYCVCCVVIWWVRPIVWFGLTWIRSECGTFA